MATVKAFKLDNEVWAYTLFIRIGGTREQAEQWLDKKFKRKIETRKGPTATTFFHPELRDHLIWFNEKPGCGLIAHESFHSVMHVLGHCRLGPPCEANEEAFAYLIGWTAKEIARKAYN